MKVICTEFNQEILGILERETSVKWVSGRKPTEINVDNYFLIFSYEGLTHSWSTNGYPHFDPMSFVEFAKEYFPKDTHVADGTAAHKALDEKAKNPSEPELMECPEPDLEGVWVDKRNRPCRVEWNPLHGLLRCLYINMVPYVKGDPHMTIEVFKALGWTQLEPAATPPETGEPKKPEPCNHWDPYDLG